MLGRRALVAIAAGVALAGAARAARADVGVVVVPARGAPEPAAAVEAAVAAALDDDGRAGALAAARAARAAGAVRAGDLATFTRVRDLVDEGWRAYSEVQTEFAVARLAEARRQAEAVLPLDGGLVAYAEAALRLGAALDNAGRRDDADDVLRLARALDPDRAVTLAEFSPDVVAAVDRAVAAARSTRPVRVVVRAPGGAGAPAAAIVEIDGRRAAGEVVLEVGQHVVVARAPGHVSGGRTFSVPAGEGAVEVAIDLDRDRAALDADPRAGDDERTAQGWVDGVMLHAEVDAIVVAASVWRSGRPALLAQWCGGAPATCTAIVEIGHDDGGLAAAARAAVDALRAARDGRRYGPTLPGDPRLVHGGRRPTGDGCAWCRPALYAGAAAVAVAAAVTVLVLATGDDGGTTLSLDPDGFVDR